MVRGAPDQKNERGKAATRASSGPGNAKLRGRAADYSGTRKPILHAELRSLLDWTITILTANSDWQRSSAPEFYSVVARSLLDSEYSTLVRLLKTSRSRYQDRLWSTRAAILARSITDYTAYDRHRRHKIEKHLEFLAGTASLVPPATLFRKW